MARPDRDRRILEDRLAAWRTLPPALPPRGWVRAIREALQMPRAELARRLGITDQAVASLERSEAGGTIRVETLRRAAEALDCTLVYALVPRTTLEDLVDARAHDVARRQVERVQHSMMLENQLGGVGDSARLVDELAAELKASRRLWRD